MKSLLASLSLLIFVSPVAHALAIPSAETCFGGKQDVVKISAIKRGDVLVEAARPYAVTEAKRSGRPPQVSLTLHNLMDGTKISQKHALQYEVVRLEKDPAKIALGCKYTAARRKG